VICGARQSLNFLGKRLSNMGWLWQTGFKGTLDDELFVEAQQHIVYIAFSLLKTSHE